MTEKVAPQDIWRRERELAVSGRHWSEMAGELRNCAEFLDAAFRAALSGESPETKLKHAFFAPKFCRLLMGLSLENLVKGQLLAGPNQAKYLTKDGSITFGSKGHDLARLFAELDVQLDEEAALYVRGWSVSSVWFGKYPFPLGVGGVLDEYRPHEYSEDLHRRVESGGRSWSVHDILHSGIGAREVAIFDNLWRRVVAHGAA